MNLRHLILMISPLLISIMGCATTPVPAPTDSTVEKRLTNKARPVSAPPVQTNPTRQAPVKITETATAIGNEDSDDSDSGMIRIDDTDLEEGADETARLLVGMLNSEATKLYELSKNTTSSNQYVGGWLMWQSKANEVRNFYKDSPAIREIVAAPPEPPYYYLKTFQEKLQDKRDLQAIREWESREYAPKSNAEAMRRKKYLDSIPENEGNRSTRLEWQRDAKRKWDRGSYRY